MKAISPVRSMRSNISNSSEHTLGISRSKSPMDDPLSLLYNMNDCYTMLKELVPSLPQNRNLPTSAAAAGTGTGSITQESPSNHQLRHQPHHLSVK
ncbi:hypothetical protein J4Q44_G00342620 [Coregonus suidteri]|uniref:BHLH domain-containing protein n=1 Tax=Coregonus suidteri TaxID=861788 RepID=A0AAN8KU25_9TELE